MPLLADSTHKIGPIRLGPAAAGTHAHGRGDHQGGAREAEGGAAPLGKVPVRMYVYVYICTAD